MDGLQGEGGGMGAHLLLPRVPEVHFFVDQRFTQSEFRVLLYSNSLTV